MPDSTKARISGDRFFHALTDRRQISITVIGRRSGRSITLPVWFVLAEQPFDEPDNQVKVKNEQRTLRARALREAQSVLKVIRWFRKKYTPEIITKLYPGPLDVAVKVSKRGTARSD